MISETSTYEAGSPSLIFVLNNWGWMESGARGFYGAENTALTSIVTPSIEVAVTTSPSP